MKTMSERIPEDERMTQAEFRCVIEYLGLTQSDAAALLEVSPRTVRHWIEGKYVIPDGVREALERGEARTADAVGHLVAALNDAAHVGVIVYRSDADMWAARPEMKPWPARWWRHVVMRAATEVPGVEIDYENGAS